MALTVLSIKSPPFCSVLLFFFFSVECILLAGAVKKSSSVALEIEKKFEVIL